MGRLREILYIFYNGIQVKGSNAMNQRDDDGEGKKDEEETTSVPKHN
jgi:hypothetical protein